MRHWVLAVTVACIGCGGEKGLRDVGSTTPCDAECEQVEQAKSACNAAAEALCHYFYTCYSGSSLAAITSVRGWTSEAACAADYASTDCGEDLAAAIRDGRQAPNPVQPGLCVGALASLGCVPLNSFAAHPSFTSACEDITLGQRQPGQTCTDSGDCAGLYGFCQVTGVCESRGADDYEIECTAPPPAGLCPGNACLSFVANQQGLDGACTRPCGESEECGFGALCVPAGANHYCVSACASNADCKNGFVCRIESPDVVGYCGVVPL